MGAGAGVAGVAGCLSGDSGSAGSISLGVLMPLSGPYSVYGGNMEQAIELAVSHVQEGDTYEGEVEATYDDTATDPGTGQQRAQEMIRQDGVDIIAGGFSSSVSMAIHQFARQDDVPFMNYAGTPRITGPECSPYTFNTDGTIIQATNGSLGYALRSGRGSTVYHIAADYEYGQQGQAFIEDRLVPEEDAELVGSDFVPLGKGSYQDVIAKAKDSGADIVQFTMGGSDAISIYQQSEQYGLLDEAVCSFPLGDLPTGQALPASVLSHDNFLATVPWYWEHGSDSSQDFTDAFVAEYDEKPYGFSAVAYQSIITLFDAISSIGGELTDETIEDWRAEMEGKEMVPQLWGQGSYIRACDHRGSMPAQSVTGLPEDEIDPEEQRFFEILNTPEAPDEYMQSCADTGCNL